jgi:hypothetical protein
MNDRRPRGRGAILGSRYQGTGMPQCRGHDLAIALTQFSPSLALSSRRARDAEIALGTNVCADYESRVHSVRQNLMDNRQHSDLSQVVNASLFTTYGILVGSPP